MHPKQTFESLLVRTASFTHTLRVEATGLFQLLKVGKTSEAELMFLNGRKVMRRRWMFSD